MPGLPNRNKSEKGLFVRIQTNKKKGLVKMYVTRYILNLADIDRLP